MLRILGLSLCLAYGCVQTGRIVSEDGTLPLPYRSSPHDSAYWTCREFVNPSCIEACGKIAFCVQDFGAR